MGVAASSGKMGFAYLVDGELMDWKLSIEASRNTTAAFEQAQKWIGYYELDAVVLEAPEQSRKGAHSLALQGAVDRAAKALGVMVMFAERSADAPNKYLEANALAVEFPQVAAWLPKKRQLWEKEPRYIILFEALSLAWTWWRSSGARDEDVETIDW
ncbi:MAG: hypothetical protein ABL866_04215 [Devosia sp.]